MITMPSSKCIVLTLGPLYLMGYIIGGYQDWPRFAIGWAGRIYARPQLPGRNLTWRYRQARRYSAPWYIALAWASSDRIASRLEASGYWWVLPRRT